MKTNIAIAILSVIFTIAVIKSSIWIGVMMLTGLSIYGLIRTSKTKGNKHD